jgi:hypothetical protein
LGQPIFEFGPPFVKRTIEEIIPHVQAALFIQFQLIDIAIFEYAFGKRQLLGGVVNEQCAFYELATVKAGENAFAPKIKMLGLKAFAPDDAFFLWPIGAHFPFAFSPSCAAVNRLFAAQLSPHEISRSPEACCGGLPPVEGCGRSLAA